MMPMTETATKVRGKHFIDPTVRERIMVEIDAIERAHGVQVIYTQECAPSAHSCDLSIGVLCNPLHSDPKLSSLVERVNGRS